MIQKKKMRSLDKEMAVVYIFSKSLTKSIRPSEVIALDRKSIEEEYLELTTNWNNTKSETIANNIEKYFKEVHPECNEFANQISEITGSSKHTVYAWVNKSRGDVKVPLTKLCLIARALNIDVRKFLMEV